VNAEEVHMSRSHRKTPIRGITSAVSEKSDKAAAHRKVRHAVRIALETDAPVLPHEKELTNPWSMAKDGKAVFDPNANPELMRK
jgi:hypothetical protein